MSRIGKQAVQVPTGVSVSIDGCQVVAEGPKGKSQVVVGKDIRVTLADGALSVSNISRSKQSRADYGTARALINNLVTGVDKGWVKKLELQGVGFGAKNSGTDVILTVGFSHDVVLKVPQGIDCKAAGTAIEVAGVDKNLVGMFAAKIRDVKPPEPYLGKGIRYSGEQVRRKAGKTGR